MVSEPPNLLESNSRARTSADLNSFSRREVGAAVCPGSAILVPSRWILRVFRWERTAEWHDRTDDRVKDFVWEAYETNTLRTPRRLTS